VPVDGVPPTTLVGRTATLATVTVGRIVRLAVTEAVPTFAVIVAVVEAVTVVVAIANVAVAEPAPTVTLAGTVALVLLEDRLTTVPPGPAGPAKVTVPTAAVPPKTVAGAVVTPSSVAGVIVNVAVADWPPEAAVMVADVLADTAEVATVKVAVVAPPGTVTNAGAVADGLLLNRDTATPPAGAA
jgi:hypothetical protein